MLSLCTLAMASKPSVKKHGRTPGSTRRRTTGVPQPPITSWSVRRAVNRTPRFNRRGDPDLRALPQPLKAAIIQHSNDNKLNISNLELFRNHLQQVEVEQARRQRLRAITKSAIEGLSPELIKAGNVNAERILDVYQENGLPGLKMDAENIVPMVNSPELRYALLAAFQDRLKDEKMKLLSLDLQSDTYGNYNENMPLESMFQLSGLNGYFYADGAYDDSEMKWLDDASMRKYGGKAKMAKSKRKEKTRRGRGDKGAKSGKNTRRVRCWTRRNKTAQKYVVCAGSRGQKSMRYKRKLRSRK